MVIYKIYKNVRFLIKLSRRMWSKSYKLHFCENLQKEFSKLSKVVQLNKYIKPIIINAHRTSYTMSAIFLLGFKSVLAFSAMKTDQCACYNIFHWNFWALCNQKFQCFALLDSHHSLWKCKSNLQACRLCVYL